MGTGVPSPATLRVTEGQGGAWPVAVDEGGSRTRGQTPGRGEVAELGRAEACASPPRVQFSAGAWPHSSLSGRRHGGGGSDASAPGRRRFQRRPSKPGAHASPTHTGASPGKRPNAREEYFGVPACVFSLHPRWRLLSLLTNKHVERRKFCTRF